MAITLPTAKVAAERLSPKVFIMYSLPKTGKTTLLSKLDDCLIIDLEDGSKYLDALKVKANNLAELTEIGKAIHAAKRPYKYVAIDTATKLEEWAEAEATVKYKASAIGKSFQGSSVLELPNGAGYLHLRLAMKDWIDKIYTLADNIILVAHLKDKFTELKGKEVSAKDLDFTGKIKNIVCQNADAIGYLYREADGMKITFESKEEITCGSRCEHLKGQTFDFDWKKIYID